MDEPFRQLLTRDRVGLLIMNLAIKPLKQCEVPHFNDLQVNKNIKNGKVVGLKWKKVKKQEGTCKLVL